MRWMTPYLISILLVCSCVDHGSRTRADDEDIAERNAAPGSSEAIPLRYCFHAQIQRSPEHGVVYGHGQTRCYDTPRTAYQQGLAALGSLCEAAANAASCRADGSLAVFPDVRGPHVDTPDVIARHGYQATYDRMSEGARRVMAFFESDRDARATHYEASLARTENLLAMLARLGRNNAQALLQERQRLTRLPERLAKLGGALHGQEQARLAEERAAFANAHDVLDEHRGRIESVRAALDSVSASYRHYQASEAKAQDKLGALIQRASTAALGELAGLRTEQLRLARVESETSGQLLQWAHGLRSQLAGADEHLTAWLGPYRELLVREGIAIPALTGARIAILDEIIGYCEARRQWMRAELDAAEAGLARREQALVILGADQATRERLIAEARARSEVVLVREASQSAEALWHAQPHAGGVELVQARYQGALRLVQMTAVCTADQPLPWMQAGCGVYQDASARARAYLAHELPAVLAADAALFRARDSGNTGVQDLVATMERHLQTGNLASAVLAHDAIARVLELHGANHDSTTAMPAAGAARGPESHSSPMRQPGAAAAEAARRSRAERPAQRTATLEWEHFCFPDSCLLPELVRQGQANFEVNGVPIPTYTRRVEHYSGGASKGFHYAALHPSLFRVGKNRIVFTFANSAGTPECNHAKSTVYLAGVSPEPILLFDVLARGRDYTGETEIELSLAQIDPRLARSIRELRARVGDRLRDLKELGPRMDEVARERTQLRQLLADIDEILERGFDRISVDELEALLGPYAEQFPDLAAQVRQVIEDMTRAIGELRAELARIAGEMRGWADELVANLTAGAAPFVSTEVATFSSSELPAVEIPEIPTLEGAEGGLGEEPDPYDEHADEVIARLLATLDAGGQKVVMRAEFIDVAAAWRSNQQALEAALAARGVVDQAEYGMFLRAQDKVAAVLARFVGEDGWFRDSPVHPEIRQLVDTAILHKERTERLKASLMVMSELSSSEAAVIFGLVFTLRELDNALAAAQDAYLHQRLAAEQESLFDSAIAFAGTVATVGWDVAVTLTPAGDLIDICEAITGKAGCNLIHGRELSWKERAFAGVGLIMWGSTAAIRKLGRTADVLGCAVQFATERLPCTAEEFFAKLADAIARVVKRRPQKRVVDVIPAGKDGSVYVLRDDGVRVLFNKKGFPEYEEIHMYRPRRGEKAEVLIQFECDNAIDKKRAYEAAGIRTPPSGFTWHHSHRFKKKNGKVMIWMQLVSDDIHSWAQHSGGMAIGREIVGAQHCP